MDSKHTPELLTVSTADGSGDSLYIGNMVLQSPYTAFASRASTPSALVKIDRVTLHAKARRLVACWNACDGIPTEALVAYPAITADGIKAIRAVEAQRDALQTEADQFRALAKSNAEALGAALAQRNDLQRRIQAYQSAWDAKDLHNQLEKLDFQQAHGVDFEQAFSDLTAQRDALLIAAKAFSDAMEACSNYPDMTHEIDALVAALAKTRDAMDQATGVQG